MVDISTVRTLYLAALDPPKSITPKDVERPMARLTRRLGSSLEDLTIIPKLNNWGAPFLIYLIITA